MNPMADMFSFGKNMDAFSKLYPAFADAPAYKSMTDAAAKCRDLAVEAMQRNLDLTTNWMQDAAKDAAGLMSSDTSPDAFVKKAGEVALSTMQGLPTRMLAYAEVARSAQTGLMDVMLSSGAAADTKPAAKASRKTG
jgi:hypothetical protein